MNTFKSVGKAVLFLGFGLLGLYILLFGYLAIRYSPTYVYRELLNMPTVYDYRVFPERKLTASLEPFQFAVDKSRQSRVEQILQSSLEIQDVDSFLSNLGTQAFLVIQDDKIIFERYFSRAQRDSLVTSFSVAKSFDSALIGIAIEEGYIKSIDDPITDYIPELAERDPRFKDIQIRHLLMMGSGLRYNEEGFLGTGDDSLTYEFDDLQHLALKETKIVEAPATNFVYNDYNPILVGMILTRATGKPVTTYLQEKLWTPLGMEFGGSWSLDGEKSQFEKMHSGINARAIDFAKFGRLYLYNGIWNGKQIVPADWVAASTTDNGLIPNEPIYYGYMWWGKRCQPDSNDFFAWGNLGQFIYVSPTKNAIIVRNGEKYGLEGEGAAWAEIFCKLTKALP